jgi:peptidyl-prolyl cis-trans isomerase A (cyclophilin A)
MMRRLRFAMAGCALLSSTACLMPGDCRAVAIDPTSYPDSFVVSLETSRGRIDVKAHKDWAPNGAGQLYTLVKENHFDDARFFRVVKGFVAQFGLSGTPEQNEKWQSKCIPDEPVKHANTRGTLSFASTAKPNTRSTQLFFNLVDNPVLDTYGGGYPPVAEVVAGLDVVDSLYNEYGDAAPKSGSQYGKEGPNQDSIEKLGNAYLTRGWPKLDYIKTARVTQEWPAR